MKLTRCYKYRLYPTAAQQMTLVQWAGCRRSVWNWALRAKQTHYQAHSSHQLERWEECAKDR
jgi:putative transposase